MSRKSNMETLVIVGGLGLLAYLLMKNMGLGSGGGLLPSAGTGGTGSAPGTTGLTNPAMAAIETTAAQQAGSAALNTPLNLPNTGSTAFTVTGMNWG